MVVPLSGPFKWMLCQNAELRPSARQSWIAELHARAAGPFMPLLLWEQKEP